MAAVRGKQKLPARSWIFDQLVARKFNIFDEIITLYRKDDPNIQVKLIGILSEFVFPKPRPEDANGKPEESQVRVLIGDEQLLQITDKVLLARDDKMEGA